MNDAVEGKVKVRVTVDRPMTDEEREEVDELIKKIKGIILPTNSQSRSM